MPVPGVLIIRPDAALFYANAQGVRDAVDSLVASSMTPVRAVVLDLETTDNLDITTMEQLEKLLDDLRSDGIALALARAHGAVIEMADRSGLLRKIGRDHVFATTRAAVAWAGSIGPAETESR